MAVSIRTTAALLAIAGALCSAPFPDRVRAQIAPPPFTGDGALAGFTWRPIGPEGANVRRVVVDNSFPYRICASMDGRLACVSSRGEAGQIATSDWRTLPSSGGHLGTPDPLDTDVMYLEHGYRYDWRTGQAAFVGPAPAGASAAHNRLIFAFAADGRTLYAAGSTLWKTINGGQLWTELPAKPAGLSLPSSPDATPRVSTLSVSQIDARVIWAGTESGAADVTHDGGITWTAGANPAGAGSGRLTAIEPSRFDRNAAYAVIASEQAGTPRLARTRDNGATWVDLTKNLPGVADVFALREDPFRRGLLFAATDRSVFISFDDGDRWTSIGLNLPSAAATDLTVRDADVIVASSGRGVWVLDDISALRQVTADVLRAPAYLYRPAPTWRVRADERTVRGEMAMAATPEGAWLSYSLGENVTAPLSLEVVEAATGDLVRRFAANEPPDSARRARAEPMPATAGLHRVFWDLRYAPPEPGAHTPGARVLPGTYQMRLTIAGRVIRQTAVVRLDPRIRAAAPDLLAQRTLARAVDARRADLRERLSAADAGGGGAAPAAAVEAALAELRRVAADVQGADGRPSSALEQTAAAALTRAEALLALAP